MQGLKSKGNYFLCIKSHTWAKDSHSLFDYESNKIHTNSFYLPIPSQSKFLSLYRKRQSSNVIMPQNPQKIDQDEYQLLTKFDVRVTPEGNKIKLQFSNGNENKTKKLNNEKLKTQQSISSYTAKEEQTYIIVRKPTDSNINVAEECKGYQLHVGQSIKLGRVQYYVSETLIDGVQKIANPNPKSQKYFSNNVLKYDRKQNKHSSTNQPRACKICLDDLETTQNFLFNPCKCSGSCGTVHLQCLLQWIHIKVRKEVIGGTMHYNFQKFECEVCKSQLPMTIEVDGQPHQLLPITKPKGNYLILEAACEKSKSVMMIQNIPSQGIKLGRGHECQIRITDISVSRSHAMIKFIGNNFVIFDNKSKFGTLVRQENMSLEVGKGSRGVQIGRTMLTFQIRKDKQILKCQ